MIKKHYSEVNEEAVIKFNSKKTVIRRLITNEDGKTNFSTRRFEVLPGGQIGLHNHPEDHHFYILHGESDFVNADGKKTRVMSGDVIYMPSNEYHGIINEGNEPFVFICVIPIC